MRCAPDSLLDSVCLSAGAHTDCHILYKGICRVVDLEVAAQKLEAMNHRNLGQRYRAIAQSGRHNLQAVTPPIHRLSGTAAQDHLNEQGHRA